MSLQEVFRTAIESHRIWLGDFDRLYASQWEQRLRAAEESALCEAVYRGVLEQQGCTVSPSEDLNGHQRAPDFLCQKGGSQFYVEVTCLDSAAVERRCGGDGFRCSGKVTSGSFGLLNDAIFDACRRKCRQLADLPFARVLAVGTFHSLASKVCIERDFLSMLLTGTLGVSFGCEPESGALTGRDRVVTSLDSAVFTMPAKEGAFSLARLPISALLVGGLIASPPRIFGLLHPDPALPFDQNLLGGVSFCRLLDGYQCGIFSTEWARSDGGLC
jgi:hypothetical protein